jgi:hypothetical protein
MPRRNGSVVTTGDDGDDTPNSPEAH